jgi:hypothetical protein
VTGDREEAEGQGRKTHDYCLLPIAYCLLPIAFCYINQEVVIVVKKMG